MRKTKAKSIKLTSRLVRSDERLIILGLFSVALLITVFVYFEYYFPIRNVSRNATEETIRVETVPAKLNVGTDSQYLNPDDSYAQESPRYGMEDYLSE